MDVRNKSEHDAGGEIGLCQPIRLRPALRRRDLENHPSSNSPRLVLLPQPIRPVRPTKKASTQTPEASTDPHLWDHDKTMPHHRYGVKEDFPNYIRDVPEIMADEEKQAEKPEIEVTPEMIEAGVSLLWSGSILGENPLEFDRLLVAEIFRETTRLSLDSEEKR
jgi:hypothetical protein